ncbi:MAG: hypothetical protein LQ343_006073 [Gyalolechia ehrenbergii]|nr:MAG: hypothetical protein LQ343_006073 [Gyalolechia ehrenbergii]
MSVMTEAVLEAVNTILPGGEDDPGRKIRFEEWVLRPAVDLAVGMKTSATSYSFSDRMTHESRLKQLPLSSFAQEGYCMINIDTRETMRANKGIQLESDGVIGHQVLLLAPGLNRCDLGNLVKRLTPDVVCVKVGPVPEQARPHLESTDKASPVHCRAESASSGELECLDTEMEDRGTQSSQRFLTDVKKEEPAEALKHEFGTR